jgi:hypothetical protein
VQAISDMSCNCIHFSIEGKSQQVDCVYGMVHPRTRMDHFRVNPPAWLTGCTTMPRSREAAIADLMNAQNTPDGS